MTRLSKRSGAIGAAIVAGIIALALSQHPSTGKGAPISVRGWASGKAGA